jgi:hypothetical protein
MPEAMGRDHQTDRSDDAQPERAGTLPACEIIEHGPRAVQMQTCRYDL